MLHAAACAVRHLHCCHASSSVLACSVGGVPHSCCPCCYPPAELSLCTHPAFLPPGAASAHDPANRGVRLEPDSELGGSKRRVDGPQQRQVEGHRTAAAQHVALALCYSRHSNDASLCSFVDAGRTSARAMGACSWRLTFLEVWRMHGMLFSATPLH